MTGVPTARPLGRCCCLFYSADRADGHYYCCCSFLLSQTCSPSRSPRRLSRGENFPHDDHDYDGNDFGSCSRIHFCCCCCCCSPSKAMLALTPFFHGQTRNLYAFCLSCSSLCLCLPLGQTVLSALSKWGNQVSKQTRSTDYEPGGERRKRSAGDGGGRRRSR